MSDDDYNKLCTCLMVNKISAQHFNILYDFVGKLTRNYAHGLEVMDGKKLLFLGRMLKTVRVKPAQNYLVDQNIKLRLLSLDKVLREIEDLIVLNSENELVRRK